MSDLITSEYLLIRITYNTKVLRAIETWSIGQINAFKWVYEYMLTVVTLASSVFHFSSADCAS